MESTLPPVGKDGDLPPGIYRATLQELLVRFGKGSRQRVAVAQRLERIYRVSIETGHVARFVVFGSFVTTKSEPADVDVFLLMENAFDMGQLVGEARVLFDHAAARNRLFPNGRLLIVTKPDDKSGLARRSPRPSGEGLGVRGRAM